MNPEFLFIDPESIAMITLEDHASQLEPGKFYRITLKHNTLHITLEESDESKAFIDSLLRRLPPQTAEETRNRILGRGESVHVIGKPNG